MNINKIYIKASSAFSGYIMDWAAKRGIPVEEYDFRDEDPKADGLLLVNANHDIDRDLYELLMNFDTKNIPTRKIDVNGTLQVAVSSLDLWLRSNKCKEILILGADNLLTNENLDRFFDKIVKTSAVKL